MNATVKIKNYSIILQINYKFVELICLMRYSKQGIIFRDPRIYILANIKYT